MTRTVPDTVKWVNKGELNIHNSQYRTNRIRPSFNYKGSKRQNYACFIVDSKTHKIFNMNITIRSTKESKEGELPIIVSTAPRGSLSISPTKGESFPTCDNTGKSRYFIITLNFDVDEKFKIDYEYMYTNIFSVFSNTESKKKNESNLKLNSKNVSELKDSKDDEEKVYPTENNVNICIEQITNYIVDVNRSSKDVGNNDNNVGNQGTNNSNNNNNNIENNPQTPENQNIHLTDEISMILVQRWKKVNNIPLRQKNDDTFFAENSVTCLPVQNTISFDYDSVIKNATQKKNEESLPILFESYLTTLREHVKSSHEITVEIIKKRKIDESEEEEFASQISQRNLRLSTMLDEIKSNE